MSTTILTAAVVLGSLVTPVNRSEAQDDLTAIKQQLEQLRKESERLRAEVELLKKDVERLKNQAKLAEGGVVDGQKRELMPLKSNWKGTCIFVGPPKATFNATCQVVEREGKRVTFQSKLENEAVWQWECELDGPMLTLVRATRVQAAAGNQGRKDLPPTRGAKGQGRVDGRTLEFTFIVPRPNEPTFKGNFILKLQPE